MFNRTTKLRWRRRIRHGRRQVEDIGSQTEENLERHLFRRMSRLSNVRRFVISWILLMVLLISGTIIQTRALTKEYQELGPVGGGTFTEGILGTFTDASPLYATSSADAAVSRLVFSGLFKYDQRNRLVGDLADTIKLDESSRIYTVKLKPRLVWQDGHPLTAEDVLFTYQAIQNPDAKSPLFGSWQNIKVESLDSQTIQFTLTNSLSSFPNSLTNGIVPKHILGSVPFAQLRSARFNTTSPVGAGPFKWSAIEVEGTTADTRHEKIGLVPFEQYNAGPPKLQQFIIRTFRDQKSLLTSFENQELQAVSGLDNLPENVQKKTNAEEHSIPLTSEVMVFFKNSFETFKDVRVRQALTQAVDHAEIIGGLGYPVIVSRSPLLPIHIGYDKNILQLKYDTATSNKLLDDAGWVKGSDGIRQKDGKRLEFKLYSQGTSEYSQVAQKLQNQWRTIGIDVEVILQSETELQTTVSGHNYDALLYGISLGIDPDVFPFWHSSQADPRLTTRLNFSEYSSANADRALEAGRTRFDPTIRAVKYQPFLSSWQNDAPAVALYQPRFLYVTSSQIHNFRPTTINIATDRYANVHNWMIREAKANK